MTNDYKEFLDELYLSYKNETFSSKFDTEALWFPETKSLFIRGSDSILDWIFNGMMIPEIITGFHLGFLIKSEGIIRKCIELGISPKTVVGHSAGGAMAQFVAYFFDCDSYSLATPKSCVKTFYNEEFFKWADKKCVIINQKNDIIGKLPPFLRHPVNPLILDTEDYFLFAHNLISFE